MRYCRGAGDASPATVPPASHALPKRGDPVPLSDLKMRATSRPGHIHFADSDNDCDDDDDDDDVMVSANGDAQSPPPFTIEQPGHSSGEQLHYFSRGTTLPAFLLRTKYDQARLKVMKPALQLVEAGY